MQEPFKPKLPPTSTPNPQTAKKAGELLTPSQPKETPKASVKPRAIESILADGYDSMIAAVKADKAIGKDRQAQLLKDLEAAKQTALGGKHGPAA